MDRKMKRAPADLDPKTREWVNYCIKNWALDQHQERLVVLAAQAWDRCQQARKAINTDGITVKGRDSCIKAHPCIAIERDSRLSFSRLIRELQLDPDVVESSKPPSLYSYKQSQGGTIKCLQEAGDQV